MTRLRWGLAATTAIVALISAVQSLRAYATHDLTLGLWAVVGLAILLLVGLASLGWARLRIARELTALSGTGPAGELEKARRKRLQVIKTADAVADREALAEATRADEAGRAYVGRYLVATTVLIGLVGTFAGLMETLGKVAPLLGDKDAGGIALLAAPLGGLHVTFGATLVAILATLALALAQGDLTLAEEQALALLEDRTTHEWIPQLWPRNEDAAERTARAVDGLKITIGEAVAAAIEASVKRMAEGARAESERASRALEKTTSAVEKHIGELSTLIGRTTEESARKQGDLLVAASKRQTETLEGAVSRVGERVGDATANVIKALRTEIESAMSALVDAGQSTLKGVRDAAESSVTRSATATEAALTRAVSLAESSVSRSLTATEEATTRATATATSAMDRATAAAESAVTRVSELTAEVTQQMGILATDVAARSTSASAQMAQQGSATADLLAKQSAETSEHVQGQSSQLAAQIAAHASATHDLVTRQIETITQMVSEQAISVATTLGQQTAIVTEQVTKQTIAVTEQLARQIASVTEQVATLTALVAEQITTQTANVTDLVTKQTAAATQEMARQTATVAKESAEASAGSVARLAKETSALWEESVRRSNEWSEQLLLGTTEIAEKATRATTEAVARTLEPLFANEATQMEGVRSALAETAARVEASAGRVADLSTSLDGAAREQIAAMDRHGQSLLAAFDRVVVGGGAALTESAGTLATAAKQMHSSAELLGPRLTALSTELGAMSREVALLLAARGPDGDIGAIVLGELDRLGSGVDRLSELVRLANGEEAVSVQDVSPVVERREGDQAEAETETEVEAHDKEAAADTEVEVEMAVSADAAEDDQGELVSIETASEVTDSEVTPAVQESVVVEGEGEAVADLADQARAVASKGKGRRKGRVIRVKAEDEIKPAESLNIETAQADEPAPHAILADDDESEETSTDTSTPHETAANDDVIGDGGVEVASEVAPDEELNASEDDGVRASHHDGDDDEAKRS